jgi:hypothetical protein
MSHPPAGPSARPGTQPGSEEAVETIVDPPPAARRPGSWAPAPQFVPKPGVRAEVRPWGAGPGQDVALELLDLSELAVRVRLRLLVSVSGRFEVTLRDPEGRRGARCMATLRSSAHCDDGTVVAVLELGTLIRPDVVRQLGGAPVPAAAGRC